VYALDLQRLAGLRSTRWSGVGRNVYFLGATSLLTDLSSEMVAAVLPFYLAFALRLTPTQLGLVDGLYQGSAALTRLVGGWLADRWRRDREVAAAGYALSAACKLGLLGAGASWGPIAGVVALDRLGKGLRTTPRDALISLSCAPERLGLAFGVHRAFDTAGALAGPLLAFALLAWLPGAYDVVFVASFGIAVVGVAVLLLFVRNRRAPTAAGDPAAAPDAARAGDLRGAAPPAWADLAALLREPRFRAVAVAGSALALLTVADSFFYLTLQRRTALEPHLFPLLYAGTALAWLLLAVPAGRLADRIGRGPVFLLGHGLLLAACACLLAAPAGPLGTLGPLGLLGAYYACTDGVLMAFASALVPERLRATGLAVLATAIGLSRLLASLAFGAAWDRFGIDAALVGFAVALALALPLTARTWLRAGAARAAAATPPGSPA